jgi:hypothetical protein
LAGISWLLVKDGFTFSQCHLVARNYKKYYDKPFDFFNHIPNYPESAKLVKTSSAAEINTSK